MLEPWLRRWERRRQDRSIRFQKFWSCGRNSDFACMWMPPMADILRWRRTSPRMRRGVLRDPAVGRLYKHDSPYTYFSSAELHLGEISLGCSRPGAAAAALWATQ